MYNSRVTLNYLLEGIVAGISTDINMPIEFMVEESDFKQYPGVCLYYLMSGIRNDVTQEHYHHVDIDVFTNCKNTRDDVLIMEGIYKGLDLDHNNVNHFSVFDKYDYNRDINDPAPPKRGKIRVKLMDGMGWEKVRQYEDVRQYTASLIVYYKQDFRIS